VSLPRITLLSAFLLVIFAIQEAGIARINFPVTGFSLFLTVLIGLMALEDRSGSVVIGFIGGLILDLSPSSNSPFGQWALVMPIIGYIIATNRESIGDFTTRPGAFVLFVALVSGLALIIALIAGSMLGEDNGTVGHNIIVVLGNTVWTFLFSPLVLPGLTKLRATTLTSRER